MRENAPYLGYRNLFLSNAGSSAEGQLTNARNTEKFRKRGKCCKRINIRRNLYCIRMKIRLKSIVYSIGMKIRRKPIVYSIRMKIRPKPIVYSIRMKMRPKPIVYSIRMKIRPKSTVYTVLGCILGINP